MTADRPGAKLPVLEPSSGHAIAVTLAQRAGRAQEKFCVTAAGPSEGATAAVRPYRAPLPSTPLRIALVCDWFHPRVGGIEIYLKGLAERLVAAGHEPHIITATPGPETGYAFPVHRLDVPVIKGPGLVFTPGALLRVRALMRRQAFDVVHCHSSILSPLAYLSMCLAKRLGCPAVITWHSIIQYYAGLFLLADRLLGWSRWPVLFSAVSPTAARFVQNAGRMATVHILPNAIDPERWRRPAVPRLADEVHIVSAMRLSLRKQAGTLIRLLPELLRRAPPDRRLRVTIAGDGSQKARLARLVRRLKLDEVVQLPGNLDQEALAALFAAADIFVLPTTQEAFGLAALEARAAGLPVVGMQQSGLQHLIRHGEEGLLAADAQELRDHLVTLVGDDGLRRRIVAHNRTTSVPWSWEASIQRHLELYALARQVRRCHDEARGRRRGEGAL